MAKEPPEKIYRITCWRCRKPFHLRAKAPASDADPVHNTAVQCPYFDETVMVPLPGAGEDSSALLLNVKGLPPENET
ncbi:MAG: hypothetical protein NTW86_20410 [Candidatus Sumerlaeota bacterium]|nr:hypothetical protein [Candidatus Sumerlaeota bacterium]